MPPVMAVWLAAITERLLSAQAACKFRRLAKLEGVAGVRASGASKGEVSGLEMLVSDLVSN